MTRFNERYPHLLPGEIKLWKQFLAEHGNEYTRFEYDVHVGTVPPELLRQDDRWRRGAEAIYLKRIDVVGYRTNEITIFEVKPHTGLGALGQVLGYLALYDEKFSPPEDLKATVVTGHIDITIEGLFRSHGIDWIVYPDPPKFD